MTARGLTPPWDTDQAAINAVEVLAGGFREDRGSVVPCPTCGMRRRLVRVFIGADDFGETRAWILVPSYALSGRVVPAQCAPVPQPGDRWHPLYAHCKTCCRGLVVLFPAATVDLEKIRAQGGGYMAMRFGVPQSEPARVGDETTVAKIEKWSGGPLGSLLAHVAAPTLGETRA